jgi:hypothetical protein
MSAHRRLTLGLLACGVALLLLGSWLLQSTNAPREPQARPARKVSRVGRALLGRERRSEAPADSPVVAWECDGSRPPVF